MTARFLTSAPILAAFLFSPGLTFGSPQADSGRRGTIEEVLVERVVWPVFMQPRRCRSMPTDQLIVTEDGLACRVASVNEDPPARVHALLVDNSGSMVLHLARLKQASLEYVKSCPVEEPVILTSFANNVILESGLSTERKGQLDAISGLDLGSKTALLDALYYMLRYLEPRPERKVVIVFTDTMDNASLGQHSDEQILTVARDLPLLTVFVIHLTGGEHQEPGSRALLEQLTEETGGEYYAVGRYEEFRGVFRAIRKRLDSEVFVSYVPRPFGEGRLDDAQNRPYRYRKVEIQARPGSNCRVISAGPRNRVAGEAPGGEGRFQEVPTAGGTNLALAALAGRCPPDKRSWRIAETLRLPESVARPQEDSATPLLFRVEPPTRLFGRTWDILAEKGSFYDPRMLREQGRYRLLPDEPSSFEFRDIAIELPDLDHVRREIRLPGDVLLHMLDSGACSGPAEDRSPAPRHPLLVHGQTWLELRRHLAEAMHRSREDYRSWARARLTHERMAKVDEALAIYRKHHRVSNEDADRLRRALFDQIGAPGADEVHAVLAEWLADVPAIEATLQLQTRLANRMLRRNVDHEEDRPVWLERIQGFWSDLTGWLPPPTGVRVVTPLVPAFDERRDIFGFYRIILPRLSGVGPPLDAVPERPFGLEILDRLLEEPRLARTLERDAEVIETRFAPYDVALVKGRYGLYHAPPAAPDGSRAPHASFETTLQFSFGRRARFSVTGVHSRIPTGDAEFVLVCLQVRKQQEVKHDETHVAALMKSYFQSWGLACGNDVLKDLQTE